MKKDYIIYSVLMIIILVLLYIVIFRKPNITVTEIDDSEEIKKIQKLESVNDSLNNIILNHKTKIDSIIIYKDKIKTIYNEKYIYINSANALQLDSIIRTNLD